MKSMFAGRSSLAVLLAVAALGVAGSPAAAQRAATQAPQNEPPAAAQTPATPAPQTFKAKYEGGVFGYNRKIEGTMSFDDASRRLVFRDKRGAELFVIPYSTVMATFADTRKRTSTGGRVASSVPTPYGIGQLGRLFKSKVRYLTMQYNDPDTEVVSTASFKVGNAALLNSVVSTLAQKADLTRRGEIFVRPRGNRAPAGDASASTTTPE